MPYSPLLKQGAKRSPLKRAKPRGYEVGFVFADQPVWGARKGLIFSAVVGGH